VTPLILDVASTDRAILRELVEVVDDVTV